MTANLNVHAGKDIQDKHSAAHTVKTVTKSIASPVHKVAGIGAQKEKVLPKTVGTIPLNHPNVRSLHISTHDKTGLYKSEAEHAKFVPHVPDRHAATEAPKVSDEGKNGLRKSRFPSHKTRRPDRAQ